MSVECLLTVVVMRGRTGKELSVVKLEADVVFLKFMGVKTHKNIEVELQGRKKLEYELKTEK